MISSTNDNARHRPRSAVRDQVVERPTTRIPWAIANPVVVVRALPPQAITHSRESLTEVQFGVMERWGFRSRLQNGEAFTESPSHSEAANVFLSRSGI